MQVESQKTQKSQKTPTGQRPSLWRVCAALGSAAWLVGCMHTPETVGVVHVPVGHPHNGHPQPYGHGQAHWPMHDAPHPFFWPRPWAHPHSPPHPYPQARPPHGHPQNGHHSGHHNNHPNGHPNGHNSGHSNGHPNGQPPAPVPRPPAGPAHAAPATGGQAPAVHASSPQWGKPRPTNQPEQPTARDRLHPRDNAHGPDGRRP